MDPLDKTHEHVHELILQHFSVFEVLELSTVSKKWSRAIGKSNKSMTKVWLNVGDRFNEPKRDDLKAFRASDRDYQNFKMSEIENGLLILLFPKKKWKGAQIDIQSFTSFKDYVNLLQIFNETIADLEIFDMEIEWSGNQNDDKLLDFPQLIRLRTGFVSSIALKPFISHHAKLEKLIIENITDLGGNGEESSQEMITKLLQFQPQLTHLSLSSDAFCKVFASNVIFDCQLQYLLIDYSGKNEKDSSKALLENFESFLSSQKNLKWVTLCEWTCAQTFQKIFAHKSIRRISFDYFDCDSKKLDTSMLKLEPNANIRDVDFEGENIELKWLKPILDASPKAENLYFFHIYPELLDYLLTNQKHSKLIKYCSIFKNHKEFVEGFREATLVECRLIEEKFLDLKKLI